MKEFDKYWEGVKSKLKIVTDEHGDEEGWGEVFEYSRSLEAECKQFAQEAFESRTSSDNNWKDLVDEVLSGEVGTTDLPKLPINIISSYMEAKGFEQDYESIEKQ